MFLVNELRQQLNVDCMVACDGPTSSYSACGALCRYWADIDTQLRRVAYEKRVKVRLLISCWASTQPVMFPFLKSLASVYEPKSKLDIQVVSSSSS